MKNKKNYSGLDLSRSKIT